MANAGAELLLQRGQDVLRLPGRGRVRRPVLAARLAALPQLQPPVLVVRLRRHGHGPRRRRVPLFLLRQSPFLFRWRRFSGFNLWSKCSVTCPSCL